MKRKLRPYLMAVPAFVVLCVYLTIVGRSLWIQSSIPSRYRQLGRAAIENAEFELARTYYERVAQLAGKRDPTDDFSLTLAAFQSGELAAGQSLLDQLAPADRLGYPKAHRIKAMQLVSMLTAAISDVGDPEANGADSAKVDQSMWELVRQHLNRSGGEDPVQLADLWTAYFLAAGKPSDAIAQQMQAARLKPDRWLATAQFCNNLKDEDQRKRACGWAESHLKPKIKDNPFDHSSRIKLAQVFIYDKRFDEAASTLFEGLKHAGNDSSTAALKLRRAASEVLLLQMDSVSGDTQEQLVSRHRLLTRAIELDANNLLAYQRLLAMFTVDASRENRQTLLEVMEQQVAKGQSIAMAHFTLGCANWLEGNREIATWHTERALELDPRMVGVMNNFAWMLAHGESPDLQRALTLIDAALEKNPNELQFRDTKGVILIKLERWDEALTEFETILPRIDHRQRGGVHRHLADIYTALGRSGLADRHRAEAAAEKQLEK